MVFSGIVEEMGTVVDMRTVDAMTLWDGSVGSGWVLTVKAAVVDDAESCYIGASIAVNGTCLTVTRFVAGVEFDVGIAPETLRCTNLGSLRPGDRVNLERSLPASARNSGHFVQGHVDSTGPILRKWREGDSLWIRIGLPQSLAPYVVPKGYIAVDGTSLTVCQVHDASAGASGADGEDPTQSWFTLMLIQHTQQCIIMPHKEVGAAVNLEVDVLSKYAERASVALEARLADHERRLAAIEAGASNSSGSGSGSGTSSAATASAAIGAAAPQPRLRLHYFDIPGKGEAIRLACAVGGLVLDDVRVSGVFLFTVTF